MRQSLSVTAGDERATESFGARLAAALPDLTADAAIVYLSGDLGAGKTTLVRGFLRALGVEGTVRSPTYTILEIYETPRATVAHLDLYRLREPAELDALGLRELQRSGWVWMIEWPERGAGRLPAADLRIELAAADDSHRLCLGALTATGAAWLEGVAQ